MRRDFKFDPGLFVTLLLATFAAWPFLTRASLPTFTDAEQHVYRTFEIMSAWRAGVLYPRWAPDLFYAFGYPVFHYYAPLTYHLGAAYGLLLGGPVAGVKFVLVSAAYLGAVGMYLFVRERWGSLSGVVSAAAFSLAPYTVYIDPHARGAAPEAFAIGLAPLMLWAFARLQRSASPGRLIVAALTLAGLILSHNLMAFVFLGLLVAWLAWDLFLEKNKNDPREWKAAIPLVLAVWLGLSLSTFMWLPAVLERDAVQFQNVAGGVGTYFDFHKFFIPVRELFAPSLIFDLGATQMRFHHNLGIPQWALAGLGALTVFTKRTRRLSALFFALAALGLVYLMTEASTAIWEAFPPITFLQFPTRLLGPAAVVLGVLAGASVIWVDTLRQHLSQSARTRFGLLAVAACMAGAMPQLNPPRWPDFGPVTVERIFKMERDGRGVGTTSGNEFLPVGVMVVPQPQESLLQSYASGVVDKINRAALPEGTQVTILEHGPAHDRFRVTTQTEFVLRPYAFYWPGWTAYVDGVRTPIEIAEPDGWITFWVPAGAHDVLLRLENTPPRWLGWGVSGVALLGLLALVVWRRRFSLPSAPRPAANWLNWNHALPLLIVILIGMIVRYTADRAGWWLIHSTGNEVRVAQYQQFSALENNVALLGYDLPQLSARPGGQIPVTLYWKALAPIPVNLRVYIHFFGPDGQLWGQSDKWNPADFPMNGWPLDRYVRDEHNALLQSNAPSGPYTVKAGLWDPNTGARMRVLDTNGEPTEADGVVLTTSFLVQDP